MVSIGFFEEVIEPLGTVKKECIESLKKANILIFILTKSRLPAEEYQRKYGDGIFVIDYGTNGRKYALAALRSYLKYVYDSGPLQLVVDNQCTGDEVELGFTCVESTKFTCFNII